MGVWGSAKRSGASPSSRRQSAGKPADSKTLAASIYGGQWSSPEPAAADGTRPCSGGQCPPVNPQASLADSKNPAAPIYGGWVRVLSGGSNRQSALPTGGSKWLSALPTGSKWSRALPGKEVTGLCNKMAESAIAEQGKC